MGKLATPRQSPRNRGSAGYRTIRLWKKTWRFSARAAGRKPPDPLPRILRAIQRSGVAVTSPREPTFTRSARMGAGSGIFFTDRSDLVGGMSLATLCRMVARARLIAADLPSGER
jgi:hypothetical protein